MKEGAIKAADTKPIDGSTVGEEEGASPKNGRIRLILLLSVPLIILAGIPEAERETALRVLARIRHNIDRSDQELEKAS